MIVLSLIAGGSAIWMLLVAGALSENPDHRLAFVLLTLAGVVAFGISWSLA